jgi:hypothetical protein
MLLAAIGWYAPLLGGSWFGRIESVFCRLAAHRNLALGVVFVSPIVIRLALLPFIPLQPPRIHDEFSYLLAGDTFAHGRLTNPTHPMWQYFDTFHVLQRPTYASMYPPAQGMFLAAGQWLGSPWIGVLLSVGAMCAAFLWMLQGWMPARWALLGSVLVMTRFAILSYWANSYWGGAVAAMGGALVMGAVPRILKKQAIRDALLLGMGAGILLLSRPLEGFIMCVPVAALLLIWTMRRRGEQSLRAWVRVVVPVAAVLLFFSGFLLYYNWRITEDPLLFPHTLNLETYHSVPIFLWGNLPPRKHYPNRQFEVFYNIFERESVPQDWPHIKENILNKLDYSYQFYLGPVLAMPLLACWPVLANRRTRFLVIQLFISLVGVLAVIWFQPHYLAPALAGLSVIWMQSLRYMRKWKSGKRTVGMGLTRAIVLAALTVPIILVHPKSGLTYDPFSTGIAQSPRQQIARQLQEMPGNHLVMVRYSERHHNVHDEWIYNGADIDGSKIVWAREIPGLNCSPLFDYFKDRQVWVVEPDVYPTQLRPYDISGDSPR